jgi:RNA polymerase sigma-70 factor (ECF subfamily)
MCKVELNDQELVKLYVNGGENGLALLLERHQGQIFHYILSKVKDRDLSNDIFQDVFMKVIRTLKSGGYNEEGKFLPWVMRIAHNLVIDHFRRESKTRLVKESSSKSKEFNIFSILSDETLNVVEQITKDETELQVAEYIDYLPVNQKEVLMMRIYQDMSFKEIAETKNISINTALGRMRYAVINIRKMMEKHGVVLEYS